MTTETTTIHIAGISLTAPTDLVRAAGWDITYQDDVQVAVDRSANGYVTRRLIRAMHECGVSANTNLGQSTARCVMCAAVTIGEIESAEARRDHARIKAAELNAKAAADELRAAAIWAESESIS